MKTNFNYLFFFLISLILILGCTSGDKFSQNLSKEVSKGHGAKISLQDLTDFNWDKVYVYGPYSPTDEINNKHETNLNYDYDHVPEGDCLYVFTQNDKLIETSLHKRYRGSCTEIIDPGIFTPSTANFVVQIRAKGSHPILVEEKKLGGFR